MVTQVTRGDERSLDPVPESDRLSHMIPIHIDPEVGHLLAGIVLARGLHIEPASPALRAACDEIVATVLRDGMGGGDLRREGVRKLLRAGGFKPAGRNKPAQEYLLRTVTETGALPQILNAVDWLNAISLESGLPISLLSASRFAAGGVIRYGRPEEKFVFNRTGQELDLAGLICICADQGEETVPLGTPIKDSMHGKIGADDPDVVAVIYAPPFAVSNDELARWCDKLSRGFTQHCGAQTANSLVKVQSPDCP
ncbi:MAG: phenylalanine--tRNA ligase beta subunit-related protein [Pirellulaceae bacterium]